MNARWVHATTIKPLQGKPIGLSLKRTLAQRPYIIRVLSIINIHIRTFNKLLSQYKHKITQSLYTNKKTIIIIFNIFQAITHKH